MIRGRIRNKLVDVEIDGDSRKDVLEQFQRDYPLAARETVVVHWERLPDWGDE